MAEQPRAQASDRSATPVDVVVDFMSPHFDAASALAMPGLALPVPDAPLLDNVAKCAALLAPEVVAAAGAAPRRSDSAVTPEVRAGHAARPLHSL